MVGRRRLSLAAVKRAYNLDTFAGLTFPPGARIFAGDAFPYGTEPNRKAIETVIR